MSNNQAPLLARGTLALGLGVGIALALLWLTVFVLSNDSRITTLERNQFRLLEQVEQMRQQVDRQGR